MYKIVLENVNNTHEYEELVKIFLRPEEYDVSMDGDTEGADLVVRNKGDKNIAKKEIYEALRELTGKSPDRKSVV